MATGLSLGNLLEKGKISKQDGTPRKRIGAVHFDPAKYYTFGAGDMMSQYRSWTEAEKIASTSRHFGQLKCLLEVLQFLNLYYDPEQHQDADLLYIGAAVGTNIAVLAKLYPMLNFHLYDSSPFNVAVLKLPNITLYETNFEDSDMRRWAKIAKSKAVFLVSDIRNMRYNPTTRNIEANKVASLKNESLAVEDMHLQAKWVRSINPVRACLKFRLPYYFSYVTELEFEYLSGTVYRQVWQRLTSSETRLVPDPPDAKQEYATTKYHIRAYENMCFQHNNVTRQNIIFANPFAENDPELKESDPIAEKLGLTNDFDSVCTTAIICDYLTRFGVVPSLEGFQRLAKQIFEGAGDGLIFKYNLYGIRGGVRFRYEDGEVLDQSTVKGLREEDPEQIDYPGAAE